MSASVKLYPTKKLFETRYMFMAPIFLFNLTIEASSTINACYRKEAHGVLVQYIHESVIRVIQYIHESVEVACNKIIRSLSWNREHMEFLFKFQFSYTYTQSIRKSIKV